ncbi:MAG: acetate/propionate family kinase [Acidobacteriota bacterium]
MKTLVVNCGSSSLKYQLFDMEHEKIAAKGLVERIGSEGASLKHESVGVGKITIRSGIPNHAVAVSDMFSALTDPEYGVLKDTKEIAAIGHRVVHGGEKFHASALLEEPVVDAIRECIRFAPLHNPLNLMGIEACKKLCPTIPQVAVFDTAFHQTMPKHVYLYAIPYEYYEKHGVRRYGFHGTSHQFVAHRAAEILGKPLESLRMITAHLGNGCSITAIQNGKSLETSMGLTPLNGLMMGQRSGDIDPALIPYMAEVEKTDAEGVVAILNKKSGLLGVSGVSHDMRDIHKAMAEGNERAEIAFKMFCYRIRKYIGTYAASMNGVDVIVFTAGIGENDPLVRETACSNLDYLGVEIDKKRNESPDREKIISSAKSKVTVMVVPTNEELMIARETVRIVQGGETPAKKAKKN